MSRATEDQFLGALLGLAIGDALGLPVEGMTAEEIQARHGAFEGYLEIEDAGDGQPISGTISDKTDVALCIVESLTTNDGMVDPENINARMGFLLRGASAAWMSEETKRGIDAALDNDGLVPEGPDSPAEAAVAVRGVPVGLLHSLGAWDPDSLARDAASVTRLTHRGRAAAALTERVALATAQAARSTPGEGLETSGDAGSLSTRLNAVIQSVSASEAFEDAVLPVVREGGEASAYGAIAGGIAGARFGASGIPQALIDGLDARIYLSMAAPWFYRTALRRGGTVIDLRVENDRL